MPRSIRISCGPVNAVELDDDLGGYGSASAIRHDQAIERQNHHRAPAKATKIIDRLNGAVPAGALVRDLRPSRWHRTFCADCVQSGLRSTGYKPTGELLSPNET